MPLVALEAMKYSLPLISTNVGGMKDLIFDGYNGFIFDLDDENKLIQALNELLIDPSQLAILGLNSFKLYNDNFNFSHFCKSYNEIIRINQ